MHEGMTDGDNAVPGNVYTVLRTRQKLGEALDGWMATKQVSKFDGGTRRLFTRVGGSVAYFGRDDILKR
jgi:hypothetical protein